MRIAVLGPSRHPLAEPYAGGQESHTAELVRALRRKGHTVRLYAAPGTDPGIADELVPHAAPPVLSPDAAAGLNLPEPDFLRDHQAYLGAVADIAARDDVDVVHNQSLSYLPLSLSALLRRPVVTTLHTPPFPWMELGVTLADPAVRFVAVSRAVGRMWSVLPQRPTTILNGVDADRFRPGPGGARLAWVGRITPEKGTDLAIRVARTAGIPLDIVGPVSDPAWYAAAVRPLLGGDVRHLGHLDHDATADVVGSSAALLVTPRWPEPFGLVAAEAAMCGTPVLAIGEGGLPEVVTAEVGVVVPPDAGEQDLVTALAGQVARVGRMDRARVRADARQRLSLQRMTDDYEALFAQLVATRVPV